jgi:hypothetical protein
MSAEVENEQPEEEMPTEIDEHTDRPSPVVSTTINTIGHSIIDSPPLLLEASQRFAGNMVHTNVTTILKTQIDTLRNKLIKRFDFYKKHRIPASPELRHHWSLVAFEENIFQLSQIVGMHHQINNNIQAASFTTCLFKPKAMGSYFVVKEDCQVRNNQGTVIYFDRQSSRFCHSIAVFKGDNTFAKQLKSDAAQSKRASTEFAKAYPDQMPLNPEKGGWMGKFEDLDMVVGTALNPSVVEDDCLTRIDGGLFVWSEVTLKKIGDTSIAGATDLKAKQIAMVCCMLQLTYELMMDGNSVVRCAPFKPFMGKALNLHEARS